MACWARSYLQEDCCIWRGEGIGSSQVDVFAYAHLSNRPLSFYARQITAGERFETTPAPNHTSCKRPATTEVRAVSCWRSGGQSTGRRETWILSSLKSTCWRTKGSDWRKVSFCYSLRVRF